MAKRTKLIVPSAINILTLVNDNLVQNRRRGLPGVVDLPSLRRRAFMIVNETGLLPVKEQDTDSDTDFTR